MTTLLLLRHGETEANVASVLQGQSESPLTALGRQQAAALGEALRQRLLAGSVDLAPKIYTSDLSRAVDTATLVAETLSVGLTLQADSRLRERRLGGFQGVSLAECSRRFPVSWEAFQSGANAAQLAAAAAHEPGADANGGVEDDEEMAARCREALNEVATMR